MAFYGNVPTTRGTGRVAKAKSSLCSNGPTASTASIDLATTASKHCPRSAPSLCSLYERSSALASCKHPTGCRRPSLSVEQEPESGPSLVRNYRDYIQGPTSAATGSSSLIGPVRAKQCSNHSGENPHRKTASRSAVHSAAASFSPVLQLWPSPAWSPSRGVASILIQGRARGSWAAAKCNGGFFSSSLFACAARHTPPTGH